MTSSKNKELDLGFRRDDELEAFAAMTRIGFRLDDEAILSLKRQE